jgi:nitric oxide reductase NorD protein
MTAYIEAFKKLDCNLPRVQAVFDDCMEDARKHLSITGVEAYITGACAIFKTGRGEEPVLVFLEEMPQVSSQLGEGVIAEVVEFTRKLAKSPNSKAIKPFLQSLAAAARALESRELFTEYLNLVIQTAIRTSPKVHGIDSMYTSPCLPDFLDTVPFLFTQLSLGGIKNWVDYGANAYPNDPDTQREYFLLKTADSRAVMQRERHGTLFTDNERKLDTYLRGLWQSETQFVPYSLAFDEIRKPVPYLNNMGIHLPDVYDDLPNGVRGNSGGVRGIDRYRALLAHLSAHQRWTTPLVADNLSPFQRQAVEIFEDARVEYLTLQEYPGMRDLWCRLHPLPAENIEMTEGVSYIRHRLAILSRALLDPKHSYQNPVILKYVTRFNELMAKGNTRTSDIQLLGVQFIAETKVPSDSAAKMYFDNTEVDYRDDNRLMWVFIEEGDEEVYEERPRPQVEAEDEFKLPPRLYPEWDYSAEHYRPDWVSVYEHLQPPGSAAKIDQLLLKHSALAKRLKKIIDLLKPQNKVRIRYQEEGSELDLDVAIRSLIEYKSGAQPDTRINMSHKHDGRSVAVSLLLDLSASLSDVPEGCTQSKLEISQEAVSLLAWAVDQMADPLAIGGFHSDTRHNVRFWHFKGFNEPWGDEVKGRLAGMEANYSTRMGAAIRHAGHYLSHQQADKKLLLVLTDGEPADIDSHDPKMLIDDARMAVRELDQEGIYTYCINLDPKADEYVADIFGKHYAVIDNIARLPERLPQLFMSLVK